MALGTNRDCIHSRKHVFVWGASAETLRSPVHNSSNQSQQKRHPTQGPTNTVQIPNIDAAINQPYSCIRLAVQGIQHARMKESVGCFDVVSKEKLDFRPAEECAGVAPAGKECECACLQSLVQSGQKNEICDSMNSYQINANWIIKE
jgi:hypothetical protein